MRLLTALLLLSLSFTSHAQTMGEDCDLKCKSQLLRVTVAPDAIKNVDLSAAAPLVDKVLASEQFKKLINGPFELPSLAFPHDKEKCQEEKTKATPRSLPSTVKALRSVIRKISIPRSGEKFASSSPVRW